MYEVSYTICVFFVCTKFPILLFMYHISNMYGSTICIVPPILHKMVPMYIYTYIWVHLMYTDYCGVLLL